LSSDTFCEMVVVTGAGSFIGGHLVADLRRQGYRRIRAVDRKPLPSWYQLFPDADNIVADLTDRRACYDMLSVFINTHLLMAAREVGGPSAR
jgi:nucleoside-diphosphate-sugar epimerase